LISNLGRRSEEVNATTAPAENPWKFVFWNLAKNMFYSLDMFTSVTCEYISTSCFNVCSL